MIERINNIIYVFTITGGGWSKSHDLYVISSDDGVGYDVYFTKNFNINDILSAEPEYLFTVSDVNLDFEEHGHNVGFDNAICTMYKMMKNGELKHIYTVGMYNNTPTVDIIRKNAEKWIELQNFI